MRFTVLASPGSDPSDVRARASSIIAVDGAGDVARAARASTDPYILLLGAGAAPLPNAFGGLSASLGSQVGVLGGAAHAAGVRFYGWMLAPSAPGPLPFEPVPIVAAMREPGVDARVRGAVDVVAHGMVLAARELLLEPLPDEPLAALVELCARARAIGRDVVCRPSFACTAPAPIADDRGRFPALAAIARRRPELIGRHRLPEASRRTSIEREVRLAGGRRVRVRIAIPPVTALVHGSGAELVARRVRELSPSVVASRAVGDPLAALRAEMTVRGDRYVLVADVGRVPDRAAFDDLVERVEAAPYIAAAGSFDGGPLLIALGRVPQHLELAGRDFGEAIRNLVDGIRGTGRAVHVAGVDPSSRAASPASTATIVYLAASLPEIARLTLTAVVESSRPGDELVAVCAASAATAQRMLGAYPQMRIALDEADPLLSAAANRELGAAASDLVVLVSDDVLVPTGALDRVRAAFARIPALGAAFPAVPGAPGGEGVVDVRYADLGEMRAMADVRANARAREAEPIDVGVTPVVAIARSALRAVGGIDPAYGPTRRGIADLVQRLRGAGYAVVRCDDALVHRFDAAVSHNPAAAADTHAAAPVADPATIARGFDPARRVPFAPPIATVRAAPASNAIVLAVGGAAELQRAAAYLAAAAAIFDASAPVRIHVLLDGSVGPADVAAQVRPVLAASGRPMDDTVTVRIELARDLGAWRAALDEDVRVVVAAGFERDALAGLPIVTSGSLRGLLEPARR